LTEQTLLLSDEELSCLEDLRVSGSSAEKERLLKVLAGGGFIIRPQRDQLLEVRNRFEYKRRDKEHLIITLATTLGCNLACGYCFQGHDKSFRKFSDSAREGLIGYVRKKASELKSLSLVWYGGEPLMNQSEIWRTSKELRQIVEEFGLSYNATIITNGYLLTEEIARRLLEEGVTTAQVTIDGTEASHNRMRPHISGRGSYAKIMENLRSVVFNTDLRIDMRVSSDVENSSGVRELLQELADAGLGRRKNFGVYFAPIEAISEGCSSYESMSLPKRAYAALEVELTELAISLDLHGRGQFGQDRGLCQATRPSDIVIAPNGDLHKCWDTISFERLKVVNISDADFEEKLTENQWSEWKASDNAICASCKILPICGGACAFKHVHSEQQSGEAASLPCISLKFNLAERLFQIAVAAGVVDVDMWDPERSPTCVDGVLKTGRAHYVGPDDSRSTVLELVN
jgi:uncharacterized protein